MTDVTYSELFWSMQGEGFFTGRPTVWLRLWNCNLQCDGFGQKDPTDPTSYDLPYADLDVSRIPMMEELPVFERGCDSSYSWAKKFKHLTKTEPAAYVAQKLRDLNPLDKFTNRIHLCFTGGEPLLKPNQKQIVAILKELEKLDDVPQKITFETNGTQKIGDELAQLLEDLDVVVTMSYSPKLFTMSGEQRKRAIIPEVYDHNRGLPFAQLEYLKFVCDSRPEVWSEMEEVIDMIEAETKHDYRAAAKIWVMPVGASEQAQRASAGDVAKIALSQGYNVSARVHTYLFGNAMGT